MVTELLCILLLVYTWILFARIILSWVTMAWSPPPSLSPIIRVIYDLTEPILGIFRRYIPPVGGIDFSAILVFIILRVIRNAFFC